MVTFNELRSRRPTKISDKVTRLPSARLKGEALARNNGRVAAECTVPMPRANPYKKGTRLYAAFNEAYEETAMPESSFTDADYALVNALDDLDWLEEDGLINPDALRLVARHRAPESAIVDADQ